MILCLCGFVSARAEDPHASAPFSRGFAAKPHVFIPKGTVGAGISATFSTGDIGRDAGYSLIPSLVKDIAGGYKTYGFSPALEYFLGDNLSLGLRFDFNHASLGLDNASLSLSDELSFTLSDITYQRQTYLGALTLRFYVPFMSSKVFGWFVEGRLSGGYAQSKEYKTENGLRHGAYTDNCQLRLGAYPGVCFFVAENVDFEVQVGLVDIGYQWITQTENQVHVSHAHKWDVKGAINLLAISFGARFYFLDKVHRPAR